MVLYRLGICYARLGQWPAARDLFSKLICLFPGSAMEPRARDYLAADGWSVECGSYARPKEADDLADRLRKAGLTSIRRVQDVRLQRHLVQVGAFPTYREARTVLAQVLRIVPEAHIVPLP
jgi:cell division septation protein DedD